MLKPKVGDTISIPGSVVDNIPQLFWYDNSYSRYSFKVVKVKPCVVISLKNTSFENVYGSSSDPKHGRVFVGVVRDSKVIKILPSRRRRTAVKRIVKKKKSCLWCD